MGDDNSSEHSNQSPKAKRELALTLKERQAAGGSQTERRKAKFKSYKETEGPRKGLTKNQANRTHGPSADPPKVESTMEDN